MKTIFIFDFVFVIYPAFASEQNHQSSIEI